MALHAGVRGACDTGHKDCLHPHPKMPPAAIDPDGTEVPFFFEKLSCVKLTEIKLCFAVFGIWFISSNRMCHFGTLTVRSEGCSVPAYAVYRSTHRATSYPGFRRYDVSNKTH